MEANNQIKIMIAEDHPVMREGFANMLSDIENFKIIGLAENGKKLIDLIKIDQPHIAIIDLEMPVLDGFSTIERLTKEFPDVKTIVYSSHNEKSIVKELIILGARGYLTKETAFEKIVEIINQIQNEGYYFDSEISKMVIDTSFKKKINRLQITEIGFTKRELEILELVCKEETNSKIADILNVSISTVDFHRRNILKKTKLSSAIGLVKYAIKSGIYNGD
jgi:DNA-binding NarL/FixJ family response regulator